MGQEFRHWYKFEPTAWGSNRHTWVIIGRHGAVHLHLNDRREDSKDIHSASDKVSGGVEVHYRQPPEYRQDDCPDHDRCWLLEGPCWHDGSSLQVSEEICEPYYMQALNEGDHQTFFNWCKGRYRLWFPTHPTQQEG